MKLKKFSPLLRGVAATTAALLTVSTVGYGIAKSPLAVGWVDGYFGVETRDIWEEREVQGTRAFKKQHSSLTDFADALVAHGIKQGEEGFALMKNDNKALPLASGTKVALFGWNAYNCPTGHTGVVAGNKPGEVTSGRPATVVGSRYDKAVQITLYSAFSDMAGITVNDTIKAEDFSGAMKKAPGYAEYEIPEKFEAKNTWNIESTSTGIVVVGRGGGEGANYKADAAVGAEDPLALSADELAMIKYAKEHCAKVVVLVASANAMELGPISKGGTHEVDAIGFCGIPNDYQYGGIANVLAGKANATGAMSDTYVYDNSFNPATTNMGEQQYADKDSIGFSSIDEDPFKRFNQPKDSTEKTPLTADNLNAPWYIVQAEGIYVGYKYYETRYYDGIANADFKANDKAGSRTGSAWNYSDEVLYTFGHGLSYIPYTQEVTNVKVDLSENGNVTATVKVSNTGTEDGKFLAQLYVQRPYTEYDITNKVEKAAVDFLNSKKVEVKAGKSVDVEIEVPTKYLASWDSNGAKTYILDEGDYYFTAAAGAHEAVNNFLTAQNKSTDGKTSGSGKATVWNELKKLDKTTFATSNGYKVTNQADDADINYYLADKVKYLTRSDWAGTFPKNYTNYTNGSGIAPEAPFRIADSNKKDEWINQLRNLQYIPSTDDPVKNVEGIIPEDVGEGKDYKTVWDWITSFKLRHPEAFNDVNSDIWNEFASALNINEAVGAILHGGNTTDSLSVANPTSKQSESVAGYSQTLTIVPGEGTARKVMQLNIASNTLLGSSFNPELAREWGLLEGECGLWLMEEQNAGPITVWGAGLNQHRHAYNGRNSEYMSEDPMLTNRIGTEQIKAAMSMGAIVGPKHMGFNDQELHRQGIAEYMTEQKMRETDIRCYQGALSASEGNGNGVMMSFSRIGAVNVTNRVGLLVNIMREEWGFTGIITTDMGQKNYHEPFSIIMATVNQYAGFGANDSFIGKDGNDFSDTATDKTWSYVTMATLKGDNKLCEMARQTNKYQLYTIAHSAAYNFRLAEEGEQAETLTLKVFAGTIDKAPWENIFIALEAVFGVLTGLAGLAWIASVVMPEKEEN